MFIMKLNSVGIIPDGNRRYAKKHGIGLPGAYMKGVERTEDMLEWIVKKGIKFSTFYALSYENLLNRSVFEKNVIFRLIGGKLKKVNTDKRLKDNGIRMKFFGRLELLPKSLQKLIYEAEKFTSKYDNHQLNLAICYGGRQEIVDAAKKVAQAYANSPEKIDENTFEKMLYTKFPAPDLVIRTGGMNRLSGFLTWETAYSELYFSDKMWPEFSKKDFNDAVRFYENTERRFGK